MSIHSSGSPQPSQRASWNNNRPNADKMGSAEGDFWEGLCALTVKEDTRAPPSSWAFHSPSRPPPRPTDAGPLEKRRHSGDGPGTSLRFGRARCGPPDAGPAGMTSPRGGYGTAVRSTGPVAPAAASGGDPRRPSPGPGGVAP